MTTVGVDLDREPLTQWLDGLPAGWDAARLHRLFQVVNGSTPSSREPSYWDGDINWVTPDDLGSLADGRISEGRRSLTQEGYAGCGAKLVPPGSLILSTRAPIGHVAIAESSLCTNQGCRALVPRSAANERYYRYVLEAARPALQILGQGATFVELSSSDLSEFWLPLPPHEVQRAIADFLDDKTAAIDQIVEDKNRLIERLEEKRQALIDYAVSGGLSHAAEQKEPTASWLPALPPEWDTTRIKHIAKPRLGSFTDGDWVESPYITDSGVRLIQTGNIGVGEYREQGFRYISESSFDELACTEVRPGDILICRLADPVGRACQAPDLGGRMITAVDVAILKPRPEHDPRFLVYFFSSTPYLKWMERISRGGTRDRISRSMLGDVKVPTPPPGEQRRIADYLDGECGEIDAVADDLREQIARLHEYRSSLITAAVTGQIDIRASTPAVA